jgi:hypothetical protein
MNPSQRIQVLKTNPTPLSVIMSLGKSHLKFELTAEQDCNSWQSQCAHLVLTLNWVQAFFGLKVCCELEKI